MGFPVVGKNLAVGSDGDGGIVSEEMARAVRRVGRRGWRVEFWIAASYYASIPRGYGSGPGGRKAGGSRLEVR